MGVATRLPAVLRALGGERLPLGRRVGVRARRELGLRRVLLLGPRDALAHVAHTLAVRLDLRM